MVSPDEVRAGTKVEARGLHVAFEVAGREVVALSELDLTIRDGEFCSIVGPSGCGKSTFLRVLAGLEPFSGSLRVARTDPTRPFTATVFQDHGLLPWMRVIDNVSFGLKARGVSRSERHRIADQVLRTMRLEGFERAYPRQLSGGMRQRVAIARAFASSPEVLLMDEPLSAVDEQTRILLQAELSEVWERTRGTVVYVTHSIDEAIALSDRVVVMSARPGRVKDVVSVSDVFPRPRPIDEIRSSARFGELFDRVWSGLRDEAQAAEQDQHRLAS